MGHDRRASDGRELAADRFRNVRMAHRQAADVRLVDDGLVNWRVRRGVMSPVERGIDDDAPRNALRLVRIRPQVRLLVADLVGEDPLVPGHRSIESLCIRVEKEALRVIAQASRRLVGSVNAVAVSLTWPKASHVPVPDEGGALVDLQARLCALLVEKTELHALGVFGVEGEVYPSTVPRRSERVGLSGNDFHWRASIVESGDDRLHCLCPRTRLPRSLLAGGGRCEWSAKSAPRFAFVPQSLTLSPLASGPYRKGEEPAPRSRWHRGGPSTGSTRARWSSGRWRRRGPASAAS